MRTRKGCARLQLVFPMHFSFSQTSTRVSITREKHGTCFLFLKVARSDFWVTIPFNFERLEQHHYQFNRTMVDFFPLAGGRENQFERGIFPPKCKLFNMNCIVICIYFNRTCSKEVPKKWSKFRKCAFPLEHKQQQQFCSLTFECLNKVSTQCRGFTGITMLSTTEHEAQATF